MPSPPTRSALDEIRAMLAAKTEYAVGRCYRIPKLWYAWPHELHGNQFGMADELPVGDEVLVDPWYFLQRVLDEVILPARADRNGCDAVGTADPAIPSHPVKGTAHPTNPSRPEVGTADPSVMPAASAGHNLAGKSLSLAAREAARSQPTQREPDSTCRGGDWIRSATMYAMMIRASTAWDHDGNKSLDFGGVVGGPRWTETGTFLKSIALLPHLKRMGISVIYLLPVTKCSQAFRKGELGCPYACKNFFELDPDLHDRLLGDDTSLVDLEFAAFIEAAHAMDMRVMIDLAPRTMARDSDLILDHPDWFYWIDVKHLPDFAAPHVDNCEVNIPKPEEMGPILRQKTLRKHLAQFRFAPNVSDADRWASFVERWRRSPGGNLLDAIADEFGVITAPGFSDCINDQQPPWTDVTFLRLYLDHPIASQPYLPADQPPYAFTDTIKSSVFPGGQPNHELWEMLSDILPFYQRYGIDGARIDMGHALPPELQNMLIDKARRVDPDFCLLAEELDSGKAELWGAVGYNAIIGSAWWLEPRASEGGLHELVGDLLPDAPLVSLAAVEMPDTPRAAMRPGGEAFARMMAVLNHFLPNAVCMINSGQEVLERQPMNLGLDAEPEDRFALPEDDPYYGKLAFFDSVAFHWLNASADSMVSLIEEAAALRSRWLDALTEGEFRLLDVADDAEPLLAFEWRDAARDRVLAILVNTGLDLAYDVANIRLDRRTGVELLMQVNQEAGRIEVGESGLTGTLEPLGLVMLSSILPAARRNPR